MQHPVPLFLPVRTKKRYFIPPAVGLKQKVQENTEAKSRAAGIVFRQQYMERPINIACTGTREADSLLRFLPENLQNLNPISKC